MPRTLGAPARTTLSRAPAAHCGAPPPGPSAPPRRPPRQSIGARAATAAEARALAETRGAPLLTMERAAYDDQGQMIEHGQHLYRASRYSFDLTLTGW